MGKKMNLVYCPKCGEVSDASLLYCEHCKESLRGAPEFDASEEKNKKRQARRLKRDIRRSALKAKKEAFFKKSPILKPLYNVLRICLAIGILAGVIQLFKINELAGLIVLTAAFICFYGWYTLLIVDNIDSYCSYTEKLPSGMIERESGAIRRFLWGLVVGGGFVIIGLLGMIGAYITEMIR